MSTAGAAGPILAAALLAAAGPSERPRGWPGYGGGPASIRYSALDQIHRGNVARLEVAWTYDSKESGGLQTNPIVVDGVLYALTPKHRVIALDAATGAERWSFDANWQLGTLVDRDTEAETHRRAGGGRIGYRFDDVVLSSGVEIMVCGHTHRTMVRSIFGLLVINAGTLHHADTPGFVEVDLEKKFAQFFVFDDRGRVNEAERVPFGAPGQDIWGSGW